MLFIPEQSPPVDQHIAFGRHYGELEGHPHLVNPTEGLPPEIFELSARQGGVADEWHSDLTCLDRPALYSILHMVKASAVGGDSLWANPAMALDDLSPSICLPAGRRTERYESPRARSRGPRGRPSRSLKSRFPGARGRIATPEAPA